jgi:hypothetical protein
MLCHVPNCGRNQVVTITVDKGRVLAHYPSCELHIVEVANDVRAQNRISLAQSREAQEVERRGLASQMVELVALVEREDRPFDRDEYEDWERWRRRIEHLDRMLSSGQAARQVINAAESPGLRALPLPPK